MSPTRHGILSSFFSLPDPTPDFSLADLPVASPLTTAIPSPHGIQPPFFTPFPIITPHVTLTPPQLANATTTRVQAARLRGGASSPVPTSQPDCEEDVLRTPRSPLSGRAPPSGTVPPLRYNPLPSRPTGPPDDPFSSRNPSRAASRAAFSRPQSRTSLVDTVHDSVDSDADNDADPAIIGTTHNSTGERAIVARDDPYHFLARGTLPVGRVREVNSLFLSQHINWRTMAHFLKDIFLDTHVTGTESDFDFFMLSLQDLNDDQRTAEAYVNHVNALASDHRDYRAENRRLTDTVESLERLLTQANTDRDDSVGQLADATDKLAETKGKLNALHEHHDNLLALIDEKGASSPSDVWHHMEYTLDHNGIGIGHEIREMCEGFMAVLARHAHSPPAPWATERDSLINQLAENNGALQKANDTVAKLQSQLGANGKANERNASADSHDMDTALDTLGTASDTRTGPAPPEDRPTPRRRRGRSHSRNAPSLVDPTLPPTEKTFATAFVTVVQNFPHLSVDAAVSMAAQMSDALAKQPAPPPC